MKKILIMSDLHCGHRVGLTPPDWQRNKKQEESWTAYMDLLEQAGRVDIVVCNGDAIEGKGTKSGGTEIIEPDRNEQVEMAAQCIKAVKADTVLMTFGTPYHVGTEDDFETPLARIVGGKIRDILEFTVEGVNFNCKHKIGTSQIPHGRHTAIAREKLWNLFWNELDVQQPAHVFIRSHVHYFAYAGGHNWVGIITPALQGFGSKYGSRQCSGTVHFGMVLFTVNNGEFSWRLLQKRLVSHVRKPLAL